MFAKDNQIPSSTITPMQTNPMQTTKMQTTPMNTTSMNTPKEENKSNNEKEKMNNSSELGRKIFNTGKEFMNMGMYMAEGRNFKPNREFNSYNINNTRKEDFKKKDAEENNIANIQEQNNK